MSHKRTIAIDFDGVIHEYSEGWKDGTIYDNPVEGADEAMLTLFDQGYSIMVFSTRDPKQIVDWFDENMENIPATIITDDVFIWKRRGIVGVTNKKLPALAYIDDRGIRFTNWNDITKYFA